MQVDAVEQRARDPGLVFVRALGGAGAGLGRVVEIAAAAGIHGGDQLEAGRIGDVGVGPGHRGAPGFQRLAQGFQRRALELRQLVEEKDAQMGQRYLARLGPLAAADERRQRGE